MVDDGDRLLWAYEDGKDLYARLQKCDGMEDDFRARVISSLDVIQSALRLFGPEKISLSFNGGKDATVILHLFRAAVANYVGTMDSSNGEEMSEKEQAEKARLVSMFIVQRNEFPEVEAFVRKMCDEYAIDASYLYHSFKESLEMFLSEKNNITAFVLGTRHDDPDGRKVEHFSPSSAGWPKFFRINPLLEWDYADVWQFLRLFKLPYCCLYDLGYTSLGRQDDTERNPLLELDDGSFRPAHLLKSKSMERAGRNRTKKKANLLEPTTRSAGLIIVSTGFHDIGRMDHHYDTLAVLQSHGIYLKKVCIISGELDALSIEIGRYAEEYDLVLTAESMCERKDLDVTESEARNKEVGSPKDEVSHVIAVESLPGEDHQTHPQLLGERQKYRIVLESWKYLW